MSVNLPAAHILRPIYHIKFGWKYNGDENYPWPETMMTKMNVSLAVALVVIAYVCFLALDSIVSSVRRDVGIPTCIKPSNCLRAFHKMDMSAQTLCFRRFVNCPEEIILCTAFVSPIFYGIFVCFNSVCSSWLCADFVVQAREYINATFVNVWVCLCTCVMAYRGVIFSNVSLDRTATDTSRLKTLASRTLFAAWLLCTFIVGQYITGEVRSIARTFTQGLVVSVDARMHELWFSWRAAGYPCPYLPKQLSLRNALISCKYFLDEEAEVE